MTSPRRTHAALSAGIATTLSVLAIAGCMAPGSVPAAPTTGAAQADAYPGTAGHIYPQGDAPASEAASGPARYVAKAVELPVASVTASAGATTAPRAIDSSLSSCWGSGSVSNPTFTATLGAVAEVTALRMKLSPVGTFAVEVSADGSTWKTALTNQRTTSWNVETKELPAGTLAKQIRLRFANGGKQVMLFDLEVLGNDAAAPTPAPTPAPTTGPSDAPTSAPSGEPTAAPTTGPSAPTGGGVTATATSTNGSYVAARAVDGNMDTEWQSGAVSSSALTVDLGTAAAVSALQVKTNPGVPYVIELSADGSTWRQGAASKANASWSVETRTLAAGADARYVRLSFANGGKNAMVFEAKAVTSGGATPAPSTAPTTAPSDGPSTTPTTTPSSNPTTPPAGGPTITVDTGRVLHPARSTVLGTNRNHVTGDFPNGQAKLAKMRELQPNWGGSKYLYRIGHGPTDGRNDYSYMTGFHFEQVWNKTAGYPYDDIREGLKDANTMGAEQFHTVNYGTSDPDEAGRYVSYLNKSDDANRAKYPYAQQNVRMFELGNEIPWSMVRGHDKYAPNETVYAQRAKLFAQKMRASSDVPIQIGAVASINSNWMGNGWSGGATTVKNILQNMGGEVDFLTYHGYPSWPLANTNGDRLATMAQNEWNRLKITNEIMPAIKQYGGGKNIWIANTEFFTHFYNDVKQSRGLYGAIYAADTMNLAFNLDIRTAVEFCFEHKELADAAFFFNNDVNNTTAIFKLHKLLAEHWGDNVVATSAVGVPTVAVTGVATNVTLPKLAYSAATKGDKTFVMVIHRLNDADLKANVDLGFAPSKITAYTLTDSAGWDAANATVTTSSPASLSGYTFKKASVTIFEIER